MKLIGMSEEEGVAPLAGIYHQAEPESPSALAQDSSFEDVELIKSQIQKNLHQSTDDDLIINSSVLQGIPSSIDKDSTLSISSEDTLNCDEIKNDDSLINDATIKDSDDECKAKLSEPHHERTNSDLSIKAGLLMSPVLLTEDVPLDVGSSNRLSSVLENISLPLLYLPTTKQLVNGEKKDVQGANPDATSLHNEETCSPGGLHIPAHSMHLPQSGSAPCELDRYQFDPERVTLNSLESFSSNTYGDPTVRLYDTSSLSSIGTEFSVSAATEESGETRLIVDGGDEGAFTEVNLHGRNTFEPSSPDLQNGAKPKKKMLSGLLSRYF